MAVTGFCCSGSGAGASGSGSAISGSGAGVSGAAVSGTVTVPTCAAISASLHVHLVFVYRIPAAFRSSMTLASELVICS